MADFLIIQTQTGWNRALQAFAEWCHPEPGWRTLDVGCGPGLLPALFEKKGCQAFGLDSNPNLIDGNRLHQRMLIGDVYHLPFSSLDEENSPGFQMITASNLLFFLPDPHAAIIELKRLLGRGGQICLLNPSEHLSVKAAEKLCDERCLQGAARLSLIDWAERAEGNHRWSEAETAGLYTAAGMRMLETELRVGPGLARYARGV